MTVTDFVHRRQADWQRLAALCEGRAGRPVAREDATDFARLYRRAVADLGRLRTLTAAGSPGRGDGSPTVEWLNAVIARAHGKLYASAALSPARVGAFFARELPRRFRAAMGRVALAAAVFAVAAAVGYALSAGDVAVARALGGANLARNAEAFDTMGTGRSAVESTVMSSFYVTNNTRIAFMAFAAGVTAGVGTLFLMLVNGTVMGVTVALVSHHGSGGNLFAFIVSHGPIELLAIFISAAAGLGMGHAMVAPGPFTRAVALRRAASDAVPLVLGAACLMVVAAGFEAWVSPSALPPASKASIGFCNAALLAFYFGRAGRDA